MNRASAYSTAIASFWLMVSPVQACQTSPGRDGTYWQYRVIDGRHCWYSTGGIARRYSHRVREAHGDSGARSRPPAPPAVPSKPAPAPEPEMPDVWPNLADLPATFAERWPRYDMPVK